MPERFENTEHTESQEVLEDLVAPANKYIEECVFPDFEPLINEIKDIAEELEEKLKAGEDISEEDFREARSALALLREDAQSKYFEFEKDSEEKDLLIGLLIDMRRHRLLGAPLAHAMDYVRRLQNHLNSEKESEPPVLEDISINLDDYLISPEEISPTESPPSLPVILSYVKDLAKEKGVEIINEKEEIDDEVMWQGVIMDEVINELVKNAIEETSSEGTVTTSLRKEGNNVVINVSDTGKGISKENIEKIFEKGFTTKPAGTGQGLTLLKASIENVLGGRIEVQSIEGRGTEFRIILPILSAKESEGK